MGTLHEDRCKLLVLSRLVRLRMRNVSAKAVEKIDLHNLFLWDNVEKYSWVGEATDDKMAHAHCMLDNQCYKNTLSDYALFIYFPVQQW